MNAKHFTSPLKKELEDFLEYKRAAGCRYVPEEFTLRCLDRFLAKYLAAKDPVITLDLVRAFVQLGQCSNTTRGHRLVLVRQFCRYLAVEDARTAVPPRNFLELRRRPYVQRILTRDEGKRFLATCLTFPRARCSPLRGVVHGTVLTLLYVAGLRLPVTWIYQQIQRGRIHVKLDEELGRFLFPGNQATLRDIKRLQTGKTNICIFEGASR